MTVTDQAGKVTASYDYTPYGQFIRKEADSGLTIPFLYNGQFGVTTDESGLYYMRARYYNVDIKRFINQDVLTGTLERISSLNRYAYVEGNPVSYLDPFGLARSIYDDWHEVVSGLLDAITAVNTALLIFHHKPKVGKLAGVVTLTTLFFDLGLQIGRAYEGVFEYDYEKIDSSYAMMGDIIQNITLTISTMALGEMLGTVAYDIIVDLIGTIEATYRRLGYWRENL